MSAEQLSHKYRWSYVLDEPARILVVDDDPILLEFASVHLSAPEVTIETARTGEAALQMLQATQFDAVLLDIGLPGMDGFAVLEQLRDDPAQRHLTTIILTGREDIASIDRAYRLGATSFTIKPVNWRQLSYEIRYVLRTSKSARELGDALAEARSRADAGHEVVHAIERDCLDALHAILARARTDIRGMHEPEEAVCALADIEALAHAALARLSGADASASPEGETAAAPAANAA